MKYIPCNFRQKIKQQKKATPAMRIYYWQSHDKKTDGYLVTNSINRKFIVKARVFRQQKLLIWKIMSNQPKKALIQISTFSILVQMICLYIKKISMLL